MKSPRRVCPAALGFLLTGSVWIGAQKPPDDDFRLKVDVNLVLVPAHVISATGDAVTNLDRDAFEIYEDGQLRPLVVFERQTALPLQLVLMIDTSLSTYSALQAQAEAAGRFFRQVLRPEDRAALYEFSGGVYRRQGFTHDLKDLEKSLERLKPRAGTALYDAIVEIARDLRNREGRRVLVIVSDGVDTTSERDFQAALQAGQRADLGIYALVTRPIPGETGRSIRGEHVLRALAEMSGGQVFFPADARELDAFFQQLRDLLRTQYLLGYAAPKHEGKEDFHRIEVRVRSGDFVRHRRGYWHRPD